MRKYLFYRVRVLIIKLFLPIISEIPPSQPQRRIKCAVAVRLDDLDRLNMLSDLGKQRYRYKYSNPTNEIGDNQLEDTWNWRSVSTLQERFPHESEMEALIEDEEEMQIDEELSVDLEKQAWAEMTTPNLPDVDNGHAARFMMDFNVVS